MEKSIRIQLLGREYPLRISEENEGHTKTIASVVDKRLRAFREAHPDQSDTTAATITCLAQADELCTLRDELSQLQRLVLEQTALMKLRLENVLDKKLPANQPAEENPGNP